MVLLQVKEKKTDIFNKTCNSHQIIIILTAHLNVNTKKIKNCFVLFHLFINKNILSRLVQFIIEKQP